MLTVPTLFILTILVFLSVRFLPGDVIDTMVSESSTYGDATDRAAFERMLGLDVPVYVQYGRWIGVLPTPDWRTGESQFRGLLQGSLGRSLVGGRLPVVRKIVGRLPVTIELGVMSIIIGLVIAVPVGIYAAMRQDTPADYAGRSVAIIGLATPNFWLATMVMIYPVVWWGWSPPMQWIRFTEDPLANLGVFIIPSLILGTGMAAVTMRMTRTMMLEVLRQDYIRTAWSKGLKERVVVVRHAVKNALIPIVTLVGLHLPILIGGSVILEEIFVLPGLGRMFLDALDKRDYPVISAINLILSTVVLLNILLIDMLYPYFDPRIRYE